MKREPYIVNTVIGKICVKDLSFGNLKFPNVWYEGVSVFELLVAWSQ